MNARFLLLPALALFVALAGCDSGAPTPDGLQTSTTVPTAAARYITGPLKIYPGCSGTYLYVDDAAETAPGYWTKTGSGTLTDLGGGSARLSTTSSMSGGFSLTYRNGPNPGDILANFSGAITANGGVCEE